MNLKSIKLYSKIKIIISKAGEAQHIGFRGEQGCHWEVILATCITLRQSPVALDQCRENLSEAECKSNGLSDLVEEISRENLTFKL